MSRVFALLAGGKASRFNYIEKLNLQFGKKSLAYLIIEKFKKTEMFQTFIILSGKKNPEEVLAGDEVVYIKDKILEAGPLGGIYSLLTSLESDYFFLHAGDMPFSSTELAQALLEKLNEGYDVSVPESLKGIEPLFGWYRKTVLPYVERAVKEGKRRVISFYDEVNVYVMPLEEVKKYCDPEIAFFNINTQEDYDKALEIFKRLSK